MSKTDTKRSIAQEKVWMKYYPDNAASIQLPKCKAFEYVIERNKDRLDAPALHYYGADITFNDLIRRVDECARAFAAMGVKEGDIVSFLSASIPETIAAVYALNKLGAAANTIDPRLDIKTIQKMIVGSGSKILVVIDIAFPKVRAIKSLIKQETIIVQSPADSLPFVKQILKKMTTKNDIAYSDKIIRWETFIQGGKGVE